MSEKYKGEVGEFLESHGESRVDLGESRENLRESAKDLCKSCADSIESTSDSSESAHILEQCEGFDYAFNPAKCAECGGKCCIGESGYVFLTKAEMARIADFLGTDFGAFTKRFVRQIGQQYSLIEKPHSSGLACVFFDDEKKCTIYPVRPSQCKKFPFWDIFKNNAQGAFRECEGVENKQN